jgi:hypothetical protein
LATTHPHPVKDTTARARRSSDVGWITFAAGALGFAGVFGIIDGVVAITKSRFFVGDAVYVFSDLNTWGWIVLGLSITEVLVAWRLLSGSELARWFGVSVAFVNGMGQLLYMPAYPFWALSVLALDVLVVYAIVAHGGSRVRESQ